MPEQHQFRRGARVRYRGHTEKYRKNPLGTVVPTVGNPTCFWVDFDSGETGLFYWPGDFVLLPVIDQLAALAREKL